MNKHNDTLKRYRIYWFTGDYWSSKGEKRHYQIVSAHSDLEAERMFKLAHPDCNFGWVEEIRKEN